MSPNLPVSLDFDHLGCIVSHGQLSLERFFLDFPWFENRFRVREEPQILTTKEIKGNAINIAISRAHKTMADIANPYATCVRCGMVLEATGKAVQHPCHHYSSLWYQWQPRGIELIPSIDIRDPCNAKGAHNIIVHSVT
jgi:hypothetical protein